MSHVITTHRPGDPRQTGTYDLSKVILCLVALRFEHNTLVVGGKQRNALAIVASRFVSDYVSASKLAQCL